MPLVSLSTNVKFDSEDAKRAFVSDFSKFCAKTIGREEKHLNVDVSFNPHLMYGGTFEPAFVLKIIRLNNNPADSQVWVKQLSTFFERKLGVPAERGLMAFSDPGPAFIGINGTTVEALLGASAASKL